MTDIKRILVTGANGQLGSEIREISVLFPKYDFNFTDYEELSITDENAVAHFFKEYAPHFCINCAAYTAVDKAEDPEEYKLVYDVNANAVSNLAKASKAVNAKFIHISTDYVFDGKGTIAYKESDTTNPVSVYGITKLEGEKNALQYTDAIILRTAWVYSSYGKNFVKTMINLMQQKPVLNIVNDQLGTPTYAADLAKTIMGIIVSEKWISGIYHYTNEGQISWFDFAVAIKKITNSSCELNPVSTLSYPTPANRPAWSVLDKTKIKTTYNITIPNWEESLEKCINKLLMQ